MRCCSRTIWWPWPMAGSMQANAVSWRRLRAAEYSNRAPQPRPWKACRISAHWWPCGRSASRESRASSRPDMRRLRRPCGHVRRAICNRYAGCRRRSTTASLAMIDQPIGQTLDLPLDFAPDQPIDHSARRHAIEAPGSVLVQAPAGSGKTTLLAQRYLRLLATVDAPERMLQALHAADASKRPAQMNAQTWELGVAARRRMNELGFDLGRHPSRPRIETIDAFNTWLAGQLPVMAGAGSRLHLTDDPTPLYEEAARRAMAYDEQDQFGHAVERVLAQDDQRWESLVNLISGMLASRDRWLPLLAGHLHATRTLDEVQLGNIRRHLDEDLRLLVSRSLAAAHQAFGPERLQVLSQLMHASALRLEGPLAAASGWRLDDSILRPDADDLPRWRAVAALLTTNEAAYRKRLTKQEGFPPLSSDKSVMTDLIVELRQVPTVLRALVKIRGLPAPAYDDEQWDRVRGVAFVLVLAAAQLEHVFRDRGTVDFPAVSMAAVRALGTAAAPTDLNLRLDYQLQHILVDEIQ